MIPSPSNNKAWEEYMSKKELETFENLHDEMGLGDCVDENGMNTSPDQWYWPGCSPEMNEGIS